MGLGDNRRTPKMRRLQQQKKLKARIKRRREEAAKERAQTKTPSTGKKSKS
ncbi:MAG TPA: hypothetical protein VH877_13580 [Polyangia bacterium]|jgi:hypothetical protein|nr:hypothetical protein [Polyangia bacterium]